MLEDAHKHTGELAYCFSNTQPFGVRRSSGDGGGGDDVPPGLRGAVVVAAAVLVPQL